MVQSNTTAAAVSLPAGTYTVGYCVYNPNPISLGGDWAMGTFQVVNGAVTYNSANGLGGTAQQAQLVRISHASRSQREA